MDPLLQIAAIAAVLGLLWLTLRVLQGTRPKMSWLRTGDSPLRVERRVALASGWNLVLVRWHNQELLLATGGQQCVLLSQQAAAASASELTLGHPAPPPPFQETSACAS